jgi:hypothetical protein
MQTVPPELAAQVRDMGDPRGWLPPWSQWWGEEELNALLPDPALQRHFDVGLVLDVVQFAGGDGLVAAAREAAAHNATAERPAPTDKRQGLGIRCATCCPLRMSRCRRASTAGTASPDGSGRAA